MATHHAEPQQAGLQRGHQAPAPARALTASTMRSRSPALSDGCTGSETTSLAARSVSRQLETRREVRQRGQPVVRNRVVDPAADRVLLLERADEPVAVLGHPDRVLVVHVRRALGHRRDDHAAQVVIEEGRVGSARRGPPVNLRQLHSADRGVDVGHPRVESDDLVLVLTLHALIAQQTHATRDLGVDRGDHARPRRASCSSSGTARTSRTSPNVPTGTPVERRAMRLRGVLVRSSAVARRRCGRGRPSRAGGRRGEPA